MTREIHHIFPKGHGGWCIRRHGEEKPIASTDTKIKAIKLGAELSRDTDGLVVLHEKDRRIGRPGSLPAEIPFPFPFANRGEEHAAVATASEAARRTAEGNTAGEIFPTTDFDNGALS